MNNLSDVIGSANLYGGSSYSFVPDRFCSPNSAIFFNSGYLQVPPGVYFSGDFTVTAWIKLIPYQSFSYQSFATILNFGNGLTSDNVFLYLYPKLYQLNGFVYQLSTSSSFATSSSVFNPNKWHFVAFVLNYQTGYIYVNGDQVGSGTLLVPNQINRTSNFIGKSNSSSDTVNSVYDDLKIYQGVLSANDIKNKYILESTNSMYYF